MKASAWSHFARQKEERTGSALVSEQLPARPLGPYGNLFAPCPKASDVPGRAVRGRARPSVVVYLEEDTATLLVGHKVHPRNTLSDHYIAELLMFVGRPLRAEARQSCYEYQFRTIH